MGNKQPEHTLSRGDKFDHYRIERLLGRGGFGEVYQARDMRLGRKVALKIVRPALLGSREAVERFLFEARATARFNHPHIITVYAVGESGGLPYVALEYLEGRPLRVLLREQRLSVRELCRLALAVAQALKEAHAGSILHRDLKPENIFIPKDGRLRVLDFGLAKSLADDSAAHEVAVDTVADPHSHATQAPALGSGELTQLTVEDVRASRLDDAREARSSRTEPTSIARMLDAHGPTEAPASVEFSPQNEAEYRSPTLADIDQASSKTLADPDDGQKGAVAHNGDSAEPSATLFDGSLETFYSLDPNLARGTPVYMSPEQWRGLELTPAADIWALGVILFEMLTGRLPYYRVENEHLRRQVCGNDAMPAVPEDVEAPTELRELIAHCLDKAPDGRPPIDQIIEILQAQIAGSKTSDVAEEQGPFRGLLPFSERHSALFFGREPEVAAFLEQLRVDPTIAVVGASGAGKSSFVQAGVIPRLREQQRLLLLHVRPGDQPFVALASRLRAGESKSRVTTSLSTASFHSVASASSVDLAQDLFDSPPRLALLLRQLAEENQAQVLLFVDQLEELYTLCRDVELRRRFMEAISAAADDPLDPVRTIVTLRDDFIGRIATNDAARRVLSRVVVLRNPDEQTLQSILMRAADVFGYHYEDEQLVQEMVAGLGAEPACLPLLSFAGRQLWTRRDRVNRVLSRDAYQAMGGVVGALARHADAVFDTLPPHRQRLARQLLTRLVTAENTRRVMRLEALLSGLDEQAEDALRALVDARLITVRRGQHQEGAVLELAHEALLAGWDRLASWLEESREERQFVGELEQAATLWHRRGRRAEEVWQGQALSDALRSVRRYSLVLAADLAMFLEAGQREQAREAAQTKRRQRLLRGGVAGVTLTIIALLIAWGLTVRSKAQEARRYARKATHELAISRRESAALALGQDQLLKARAMTRGALDIEITPRGRYLWWQLAQRAKRWEHHFSAPLLSVRFSADGDQLVATLGTGIVVLIDADSREIRKLVIPGVRAKSAQFRRDGKLIISTKKGSLYLLDPKTEKHQRFGQHERAALVYALEDPGYVYTESHRRVIRWKTPKGGGAPTKDKEWYDRSATRLFFSADDRPYIAFGVARPIVRPLDDPKNELGVPYERCKSGIIGHMAVHSSKHVAYSCGIGMRSTIHLTAPPKTLKRLANDSAIFQLRFTRDGRLLAWGTREGFVELVDGKTLLPIWRYRMSSARLYPRGGVTQVYFSRDGRRMVAGTRIGKLVLWHLDPIISQRPGIGHSGGANDAAFSPDGRLVASGGADGMLRIWNRKGELLRARLANRKGVLCVAFSRDGKRVFAGGFDHYVRAFDVETLGQVGVGAAHTAPVMQIALSPDGRKLAGVTHQSGVHLWNARSMKIIKRLHTRARSAAFHPQTGELYVATGKKRSHVAVYDAHTGAKLRDLTFENGASVQTIQFAPSGLMLLRPNGMSVARYTANNKLPVLIMQEPGPPWPGATLADHEARLVVHAANNGHCSGCAFKLRTRSYELFRAYPGHRGRVTKVAFDPRRELLVTSSIDSSVRFWSRSSGHIEHLAPLAMRNPPRLLTRTRGIVDLRSGERKPLKTKWQRHASKSALMAEMDSTQRWLCMFSEKRMVEIWDTRADRRVADMPSQMVSRLLALPNGTCYVHDVSTTRLIRLTPDGKIHRIRERVHLAAIDDQRRVARYSDQTVTLYRDGRALISHLVPPHVRYIQPIGDELAIYHEGRLSLYSLDKKRKERTIAFGGSTDVAILSKLGTNAIAVGRLDGYFQVWDMQTRRATLTQRLNGAVIHLMKDGHKLYVASELGDYRVVDLSALYEPPCKLMKRVWKSHPVVWTADGAKRRPPPFGHTCAPTKPGPSAAQKAAGAAAR
jgi:serine/threonine protein kinase/WD40 repeat protein